MGLWHKTGCVLCAQNCGLEILVEDDRMVKVKPDKENPRSKGYACRKGLNVIYHQYPKDRITRPLKRVGDTFEPVSWDQAIDEIAVKMKSIVNEFGPRSLAYMGGSSQGCSEKSEHCPSTTALPATEITPRSGSRGLLLCESWPLRSILGGDTSPRTAKARRSRRSSRNPCRNSGNWFKRG